MLGRHGRLGGCRVEGVTANGNACDLDEDGVGGWS